MENNSNSHPAPPPGYPAGLAEEQRGGQKPRRERAKARGEKGFIEGCIAALCCCWICDMCCA